MELTTSWEEKGRQQGRQEGEANVVLRLLRRRCGDLAPALQQRVTALPSEQLESLAEALLDFTSAADLERWFEGR